MNKKIILSKKRSVRLVKSILRAVFLVGVGDRCRPRSHRDRRGMAADLSRRTDHLQRLCIPHGMRSSGHRRALESEISFQRLHHGSDHAL